MLRLMRYGLLLVLCISIVLGGLSCGESEEPTATKTPIPTAATTTPKSTPQGPQGTITVAINTLGEELLEQNRWKGGFDRTITECISRGLTWPGVDRKLDPAVATSWTMSEDGLTWEFTIREGVKFHNGELLTLADVKYGIERFMTLDSRDSAIFKRIIDRVEITEPNTVTIHLKEPYLVLADRMYLDAHPNPKAYIEQVGAEAFGKNPIGTGPFKFVKREIGSYVEFEAFEDYFGDVPDMKTLILKLVPEAGTRLAMLKTGQADIMTAVPFSMAKEIENDPKLRILRIMYSMSYWLWITDQTIEGSPTSNVKVRQALNYAIDKKAIVENILYGYGATGMWMIPPNSRAYDPNALPDIDDPYPYNPEKARSLLAEAGYGQGFDIVINYPAGRYTGDQDILTAVSAYWQAIGVRAKMNPMDAATYFSSLRAKSLTGVALAGTSNEPDEGGYFASYLGSGQVYSSTADPVMDYLIQMQDSAVDPEVRIHYQKECYKYWHDHALVIFLPHIDQLVAVNDRIEDWPLIQNLFNITGFETIKLKQ